MCQTKDAAIRDWVRLAVERARETGAPAVFWLDETRAHDAQLLEKVRAALSELDTDGLQIEILDVAAAARFTLERARDGRGHDLGHRQRPARLPHRPVPDPRARHQRQDAVDRAADGRRRPVRDRGRRLGAPSTSSSSSRRTTCAGTHWASSWRSVPSFELLAEHDDKPRARAARGHARPRHRPRARGEPLALAQGPASSTTAAATSISRSTGRRSWPGRARTRSWPSASRRWPSGWRRARRRSSRSWRRAGLAGRHRRLLPARSGADGGGDAAELDAQRRLQSTTLRRRGARASMP